MIQLVPVTAENWEACCELTLTSQQQDFMEANVYSIAQAKFEPSLVLRAIIAGEAVVGFVMYNTELEELDGLLDLPHHGRSDAARERHWTIGDASRD